ILDDVARPTDLALECNGDVIEVDRQGGWVPSRDLTSVGDNLDLVAVVIHLQQAGTVQCYWRGVGDLVRGEQDDLVRLRATRAGVDDRRAGDGGRPARFLEYQVTRIGPGRTAVGIGQVAGKGELAEPDLRQTALPDQRPRNGDKLRQGDVNGERPPSQEC